MYGIHGNNQWQIVPQYLNKISASNYVNEPYLDSYSKIFTFRLQFCWELKPIVFYIIHMVYYTRLRWHDTLIVSDMNRIWRNQRELTLLLVAGRKNAASFLWLIHNHLKSSGCCKLQTQRMTSLTPTLQNLWAASAWPAWLPLPQTHLLPPRYCYWRHQLLQSFSDTAYMDWCQT